MDESWDDWRIVHAAWAHGSFTAAAEALGMGQATVSRRIARIEEALGHVLFDRHRTGLVPTEAALALRERLEGLVAAAHGLSSALEGLDREPAGIVRIAAPPGICVDVLPELALRLRQSHPQIQLEVLAGIPEHDLGRRHADLAVRFMPTTNPDLLVRRVATVRSGLFAAPSLLASFSASVAAHQLPLVQWSDSFGDIPMARAIDQLGGPIVMMANDYLVLRAAVVAGVGASLLSAREAHTYGLREVPVDPPVWPELPLYLVVHRAMRAVPRVAVVIDAIDALIRDRPEENQPRL